MLLREISMRYEENMKRNKVSNLDGSTPSLTFIIAPSSDVPKDNSFEEIQRVAHRPTDVSTRLDKAILEVGGVSVVSKNLRDVTRLRSLLKF